LQGRDPRGTVVYKEIQLDVKNITTGLEILRNMETLVRINGMDASEFWRSLKVP
jgi:hypothetical protein